MNAPVIKTPKKLIEVALPLDDINEACAREKQPGIGAHPRGLHLWWARRPLAAARAVIFAQMVNDPGYERTLGRGVNKEKAKVERERLFEIIRKLVLWENTNNKQLLAEARSEIWKSWRETCELNASHPDAQRLFNPDVLPEFHDPFAGGGAIPLEAKRLGLVSYATDLNPVAVLINKSMIEIPSRFAGQPPVCRAGRGSQQKLTQHWDGATGLAEDIRRYGALIGEIAKSRIGHLYPPAKLTSAQGSGESTVLAWIWARTVRSPNPAYSDIHVPLATTFVLSSKPGKEAYVEPVIEGREYSFKVVHGVPTDQAELGTKAKGRGSNFYCLLSGSPINADHIRTEGLAGRLGYRLLAVIADGGRGKIYLAPTADDETIAKTAKPTWRPDIKLPVKHRNFQSPGYGLGNVGDLFTDRQLVALGTLSELIQEIHEQVVADAVKASFADDGVSLENGGSGAQAYADAVSVYLAFAIDRLVDYGSSLATWKPSGEQVMQSYKRQALQMTWDFPESNVFAGKAICWANAVKYAADNLDSAAQNDDGVPGYAEQMDAQHQSVSSGKVVSTDPPYYDNIAYADLSDFFYVWLRKSLRKRFPKLFNTIAVPKEEELVASTYRLGSKENAEKFFLDGMTEAMGGIATHAHPSFPATIYYAFKQSDTTDVGTGNTGWETFLEAVIRSGFAVTGTWPMRTELANRIIGAGSNVLASSIVLVCRRRATDAPSISRRDFLRELKEELSDSVEVMIGGAEGISPVAPVDLAQAVIGPGMAIFSKYSAVLEADGSSMNVHTALTLINRMLTEGADEFDADTQFCLGWFDEQGWAQGEFGQADVLARAKGTSVDHIKNAGVIEAGSGKVRLLKPVDYSSDWSPKNDNNTPVWEALHQLIRALREHGESEAGVLLAGMPQRAEPIRNLAYRLYTLCERKGWAEDARAYNELITSWIGIEEASHVKGHLGSQVAMDI
ncbi:hypothetical protein MasN3_16060 [Massilia varians]|uniref:DUF1156 domain-containing protein n=1 Tax=Massilia varians TaxID=457921 RepID=A0ABM8C4J1_9BURK|nr:DUF1156 domain-containing protein [Massilia varians]BDT58112.1 hypothetical protein MasN3_16060 [Massilia varians]